MSFVRVMCDYSADGLWAEDGTAAHPDDYPIDAALKARLRAWQDWFEQHLFTSPPPFEMASFNAEGRAIAYEMKLQLPDTKVLYFDTLRSHESKTWSRGDDRSYFEYAIDPMILLDVASRCPGWTAWMIEGGADSVEPIRGYEWCVQNFAAEDWNIGGFGRGWVLLLMRPGKDALFRMFNEGVSPMRPVSLPDQPTLSCTEMAEGGMSPS